MDLEAGDFRHFQAANKTNTRKMGCKSMADIALHELIRNLRDELERSVKAAEGARLKFELDRIDLEVQVCVEKEGEASGGVKFWVYEVGVKGKLVGKTVHTIRLGLKPKLGGNDTIEVAESRSGQSFID